MEMNAKKERFYPAPLFRDPVFDGPSDPTVLWNRQENCWYLFYTQRRSTSVQDGFSSIHGSEIGIASSPDLKRWLYRGTLKNLDIEHGHNTFWAPEIIEAEGCYHMFVSYVTGIPTDWEYPRHILHYTSVNLWDWNFCAVLPLSSERVIDACVYEIQPHFYKMWYKDEVDNSYIHSAVSRDLYHWDVLGREISDVSQEGPNVFVLEGRKWLISDYWHGLAVYESPDFTHWTRRADLLNTVSEDPAHITIGHHADILEQEDGASIFYFTGQVPDSCRDPALRARLALQAGKLAVSGDNLVCLD